MNRRSDTLSAIAGVVISLILVSRGAYAGDAVTIVSDVDDTVKISDVPHGARSAMSGKAFAGMPELYRRMLGQRSSPERLQFLSGSPELMRDGLRAFFDQSQFPERELTLKPTGKWISGIILGDKSIQYKVDEMKRIQKAYPGQFILFGDDTEKDPEVYAEFRNSWRQQVLVTYIHRIVGENTSASVITPATGSTVPQCVDISQAIALWRAAEGQGRTGVRRPKPECLLFTTAYDVARYEYLQGGLKQDDVTAVGRAVLAAVDTAILPDFQACPDPHVREITGLPTDLADLQSRIQRKLDKLCEARKKVVVDDALGGFARK